ncbi:hypothetical protein JCM6292_2155 [Bacteroides pyogenes JCM 6292]|uniref:Uncharacterized protein n=1 Tax=Bacteroides pyogenes JCM 6292 TaxID=1235809 RepID=W4P7T3_9BACE|nr:hypothetical protein JCM6292_2155 [Bacteroides pyogenes JCM 6292]
MKKGLGDVVDTGIGNERAAQGNKGIERQDRPIAEIVVPQVLDKVVEFLFHRSECLI